MWHSSWLRDGWKTKSPSSNDCTRGGGRQTPIESSSQGKPGPGVQLTMTFWSAVFSEDAAKVTFYLSRRRPPALGAELPQRRGTGDAARGGSSSIRLQDPGVSFLQPKGFCPEPPRRSPPIPPHPQPPCRLQLLQTDTV